MILKGVVREGVLNALKTHFSYSAVIFLNLLLHNTSVSTRKFYAAVIEK